MSAVIDSSVVVAALVDAGAGGVWAEEIVRAGGLYAPHLLCVEAADVLRRLEATRQISGQEASAAFDDLLELEVELHAFEPFSERIWELRHNVTPYDGWYVALAEALELPFATLDGRLGQSSRPEVQIHNVRFR